MGNNKMIVEERSRDIGNFLVGRLLPFREKRQVGPFTFIDHMGPAILRNGHSIDIDQHPHIGLSTLTYLLEGEIEHRDSTGSVKIITPGSVNFMTAGKAVAHTERIPAHLKHGEEFLFHGYQVWVAMPKDKEDIDPNFVHIPKEDLPAWEENGLHITLISGEGYGRKSPLPVFSDLFMLNIKTQNKTDLEIKDQLKGEIAIVVVKGTVQDEDERIEQGHMLISKTEDECKITLFENTQILIFGGKPFPEPRFLYWNFVSSSKEKLESAKQDWKNKKFPKVPGDDTYIPLP